MSTEDKEILNNIINGYAGDIQQLEDENRILKETVAHLKREVAKFQQPPLLVAEVKEAMGEQALLKLNNGNEFFVMVGPDAKDIVSADTVLVEQKNLTIIKKIKASKSFSVDKFVIMEKPTVEWSQIGGLDREINEIKEVVELPLLKPKLFEKVGITPPKGVLLHGPPGTGKTSLAKAVAAATNSTFIEIVGSELVQKFIGEGAKLIKDIFQLARENAPAIIFIDEIDALAAKRIEIGTSGEREVQRTFMQFLAEVDGFKNLGNVKIIGCTNRKDILDPAVTRPGRLDRLIYVGNPDIEGIKKIFGIHTGKMKIDSRFNIDHFAKKLEGFSGAEIKAVCTEAGYFAIRSNRTKISKKDFEQALEKVKTEEARDNDYIKMFG